MSKCTLQTGEMVRVEKELKNGFFSGVLLDRRGEPKMFFAPEEDEEPWMPATPHPMWILFSSGDIVAAVS